ncbi:meiotic PUF protein 1 [Rhodosporidiobolus nylandii]
MAYSPAPGGGGGLASSFERLNRDSTTSSSVGEPLRRSVGDYSSLSDPSQPRNGGDGDAGGPSLAGPLPSTNEITSPPFLNPSQPSQHRQYTSTTPPYTPSPTRTRSSRFSFAAPAFSSSLGSGADGSTTPLLSANLDVWANDPLEALEGRQTPFFLALPGGEDGQERARTNGGAQGYTFPLGDGDELVPAGTAWIGGDGGLEELEGTEDGVGDSGETESGSGSRPAELDRRRDSGYSEANFVSLSHTVGALTARVGDLTHLANTLYSRVGRLERTASAQSRELDDLRRALQSASLASRLTPQPISPVTYGAPPLPLDCLDYPTSDGGDLTPPASAPVLRHPHPHHQSQGHFPYDESRSSTPRSFADSPVARSRAHSASTFPSFGEGGGDPYIAHPPGLNAPFPPHVPDALGVPVSPYSIHRPSFPSSGHSSFGPSAFDASAGSGRGQLVDIALRQALHQDGIGSSRQRSMSVASGSVSSGGTRMPLHGRTASLPGGGTPRGLNLAGGGGGMNGIVEQLNYRVLLESDSDIDSEAFVRRILRNNDQQCSLFLQQRVRTTTPERKQQLFEAVGQHVLDLGFSKFGNFLVSRCLEAGDLALAKSFEATLTSHFLELSLDPFGCHVVQKLLDCGDSATKDRVIEELMPHPTTLMQKNSGHVWNRILTTRNPPMFYRRLAEMGEGTWADVVKDDGGSLIVQHMLEDWTEAHMSGVAREVLAKADEVATSPCGSFVLSHLIDRNALPFAAKLMQSASQLALDNFGAKMIDKCLRTGRVPSQVVSSFVDSLVEKSGESSPPLVAVASHVNGSNLVSHLLTSGASSYRDKEKLVRCITSHGSALTHEGGAHGAKLVGMCARVRA